MIATNIQKNNWSRTSLIIVVLGAIWLNFTFLPCVHANAVDLQSNHKYPQCPVSDRDPCHNSNCENCDSGLNTLKTQNNTQKYNLQIDDYSKFALVPSLLTNGYINDSYISNICVDTLITNDFLPIYIKNCAFLN